MHFTDIFIRRPVLSIVLSLTLAILGARAFDSLTLREYPEITYPTITITTTYPGASADLVQGFITAPLQSAVASAEGIDYLESTSNESVSVISAHLYPDHDIDAALLEITSKVNKLLKTLPLGADDPIVTKDSGFSSDSILYLSFTSDSLSQSEITEYLSQAVVPVLTTLPGVSNAGLSGERPFAMRIWLDADRMAAFDITTADVNRAISENNFPGVAGQTKGRYREINISPDTGLSEVKEFNALIIKTHNGAPVRLNDIARVEMGAAQEDSSVTTGGKRAVFIGISAAERSNPLEVADSIYAQLPEIESQLPGDLSVNIPFDSTTTIRHSIEEVNKTIIEAGLIVIAVVFLFLGSLRSVAVPVVAIPLSLIGVTLFMVAFGFSLNLLTLLAMVLAIGLVVDDAIVVVENIQRHIEKGQKPLQAALEGAREIAFPVIAMTLTLAAVYAPIGLVSGLTGTLFTEFAFTLAGAVIISGIIALTLSPMMCSRLLSAEAIDTPLVHWLDQTFDKLQNRYRGWLKVTLEDRSLVLVFSAVVVVSLYFLFMSIPQELAPTEDSGELFVSGNGPLSSSLEHTDLYVPQIEALFAELPEYQQSFIVSGAFGSNALFSLVMLKPWDERERNSAEIQRDLSGKLNRVSGLRMSAFQFPSLPGASADVPIKFVLSSTGSYLLIHQVAEEIVEKAEASGLFVYVESELKFENPQLQLQVDRDKAAELGIPMSSISDTLVTFLSENESSDFNLNNRSYDVILQVERHQRSTINALADYHVRSESGVSVPLSTVVTQKMQTRPNTLQQFQQLNSTTIGAMMAPGVTIGEGIALFEKIAAETLPVGFSNDFLGQSRQFIEEGNKLLFTFLFSFVMIYLVLAAQFESFTDPLIVLISVPLSVCGALFPLALGFATMNIYTQVGLLTLIGLISKHGILIVDFANKLRESQGLDLFAAVEEAAAVRLRPILMTTAAMVFGVLPLILASGAGAKARSDIGIVIFFGMSIGTLFTLFVLPAMYTLLARKRRNVVVAEGEDAAPMRAS